MTKLRNYDTVRHLDSEEMIFEYYLAVSEEGTSAEVDRALTVIARAKVISDLATKTGRTYREIYELMNGDGEPNLSTVLAIFKTLGVSHPPARRSKNNQDAA
ncbi:addiction module antidote protein [Phyllobacterium sp. YR531]|uniref:addiction module antidote protein n=1 Tax=Phyllobacterium sp. YR531 TaxID=1144343 RepID=UPI00026F5BD0|nr:addiction module antidote protein [Phyllobacterium sp. YR531]EJM98736.1 putative addiction module antidote protein [Phyllobacterium sp. YR531]